MLLFMVFSSVADPDPFHFRLKDPALYKKQTKIIKITYYKNWIICTVNTQSQSRFSFDSIIILDIHLLVNHFLGNKKEKVLENVYMFSILSRIQSRFPQYGYVSI